MTAAVTLAGWFLVFAAWFALSLGLAVLIGKAIAFGNRDDFETHGREQLGITSISSYVAEQDAKVQRARFRHLTRHGKDAA